MIQRRGMEAPGATWLLLWSSLVSTYHIGKDEAWSFTHEEYHSLVQFDIDQAKRLRDRMERERDWAKMGGKPAATKAEVEAFKKVVESWGLDNKVPKTTSAAKEAAMFKHREANSQGREVTEEEVQEAIKRAEAEEAARNGRHT